MPETHLIAKNLAGIGDSTYNDGGNDRGRTARRTGAADARGEKVGRFVGRAICYESPERGASAQGAAPWTGLPTEAAGRTRGGAGERDISHRVVPG